MGQIYTKLLVSEPDCRALSQFGSLVLTVWDTTSQITVLLHIKVGPRNLALFIVVLSTVSRVVHTLNALFYNNSLALLSLTITIIYKCSNVQK